MIRRLLGNLNTWMRSRPNPHHGPTSGPSDSEILMLLNDADLEPFSGSTGLARLYWARHPGTMLVHLGSAGSHGHGVGAKKTLASEIYSYSQQQAELDSMECPRPVGRFRAQLPRRASSDRSILPRGMNHLTSQHVYQQVGREVTALSGPTNLSQFKHRSLRVSSLRIYAGSPDMNFQSRVPV